VKVPLPLEVVVDTNVPVAANGGSALEPECVAASATALHAIMRGGRVYLDDLGGIVQEYRRNLHASGEPGPGDAFLRWVLTHEWGGEWVIRVPITPVMHGEEPTFVELPDPPEGVRYDPSDRKFLAVAAAHPERPPILEAGDSKWWGWREALSEAGVRIHFLCPETLHATYDAKMPPPSAASRRSSRRTSRRKGEGAR